MTIKDIYNYLLKKKEEGNEIYITNFNFIDYNYFTFEYGHFYYYIEESDNHYLYDLGRLTATSYIKIDYNTKQQVSYSITIECIEDLKDLIAKNEKDYEKGIRKPLKDTYKQVVNYDFAKYKRPDEKNYHTIFDEIMLGYREITILQNIQHIEMLQNDENYKVYNIYDDKNYFQIEYYSKRVTN